MSLVQHFSTMSLYNQRMNEQLLHCCSQLSEEMLLQNTETFFTSIISYWNHIAFGDLLMLKRLVSNNIAGFDMKRFDNLPAPQGPTDIYCESLAEFKPLRATIDAMIIDLFSAISEKEFDYVISYQTTEGDEITQQVSVICAHLFNHQTHHRGQLTCVLSKLGVDFGCTDLPVIIAN